MVSRAFILSGRRLRIRSSLEECHRENCAKVLGNRRLLLFFSTLQLQSQLLRFAFRATRSKTLSPCLAASVHADSTMPLTTSPTCQLVYIDITAPTALQDHFPPFPAFSLSRLDSLSCLDSTPKATITPFSQRPRIRPHNALKPSSFSPSPVVQRPTTAPTGKRNSRGRQTSQKSEVSEDTVKYGRKSPASGFNTES